MTTTTFFRRTTPGVSTDPAAAVSAAGFLFRLSTGRFSSVIIKAFFPARNQAIRYVNAADSASSQDAGTSFLLILGVLGVSTQLRPGLLSGLFYIEATIPNTARCTA